TATPTGTPTCATTQPINGSIQLSDPQKHSTTDLAGVCGVNNCPGDNPNLYHYDSYVFINSSSSAQCVTVNMNASGCGTGHRLRSNADMGTIIDPNNGCTNFLVSGLTSASGT